MARWNNDIKWRRKHRKREDTLWPMQISFSFPRFFKNFPLQNTRANSGKSQIENTLQVQAIPKCPNSGDSPSCQFDFGFEISLSQLMGKIQRKKRAIFYATLCQKSDISWLLECESIFHQTQVRSHLIQTKKTWKIRFYLFSHFFFFI